jgi:dipeptidyl-peptidase-4
MAVLSEAYSNDDFRTRVASTYDFVREVLSVVAEARHAILALNARAPTRPDSVVVRSRLGSPTRQRVIAEITRPAGQGNGGFARRKRSGIFRAIEMPVYDRFGAARREAMPEAYLIPSRLRGTLELLHHQGITVESLAQRAPGQLEVFQVDSVVREPLFEGHHPVRLEGRWFPGHRALTASSWKLVRTAQPLGILAAYLLEPTSEDGVVTWNLLDDELSPGEAYPILRSRHVAAAADGAPARGLHAPDR